MPKISIRERGTLTPNPVVTFDDQEYGITVTNPFTAEDEQQLEWYFEEHLRFPFTQQVRAQSAAASITAYGHNLFEQIFADRRAYASYKAALQNGLTTLTFEIAGSPAFQQLHWEALKDPALPQPFALHAPFVRRNLTPRVVEARLAASPTLNLLVVTARPGVGRDVGYRTISRPLIQALRQADLPVQVDILRPGSYEALAKHLAARLDQHGVGYYHVIHFDVHGALLTHTQFDQLEKALPVDAHTFQPDRFGRPVIPPYAGQKAFLFFESGAPGTADPAEAGELADLLLSHQIPIAILNACQSGKQVGATETSLGSQLMRAGLQMVLAMGYSVTVSAAERMMTQLYQQLFQGGNLAAAIRRARQELYNRKERRAYYNQTINLEDWLLPVVYQNQPQQLTTRPFTDPERNAYYARQATRYREPPVTYGFVGRDLDVLQIEQRLLRQGGEGTQNLLLVRGLGGAGKSTLLHHLAAWWQTTGLIEQVSYFGYDERAWTLPQLLDALARQLLGEPTYFTQFQPLSEAARQAFLASRLRATRHLLILDNLESITGSNLAILNTLTPDEQHALHGFLQELAGGKTLVLLGSRGPESWLAPGAFAANVYELGGLDPEAATTLADRILERQQATAYRADPAMQTDLHHLITLLAGHPLALEVVLANLARQTPAQVLAALQTGDASIDPQGQANTEAGADEPFRIQHSTLRTQSILHCIAYSHSNLSPEAQQLLLCLAPFTGVINRDWLPQYTTQLQAQPDLAALPYARWDEVLQEAINWGLLTPDASLPTYLRIQPIFPYFLRTRLQAAPALREQIERAFQQHYDGIGQALAQWIRSSDAQEKHAGQVLIPLEYENLLTAVQLALANFAAFFNAFNALYHWLVSQQAPQRALALSDLVLQAAEQYPPEKRTSTLGEDFFIVYGNKALLQLMLKQYAAAEATYQATLTLIDGLSALSNERRSAHRATTYHQLGYVAQEQRQWAQAEQHYQHALAIKIEYNDRYSQATTYHQLGYVAQEQRLWSQAEQHYQHALAIFIEYNDRYSQATTYHELGIVAQEQRQWAQAEQHYRHALAIKIDYNDRYSQASTYHQLGSVAQEQRQWAQAKDYLLQALRTFVEFNDEHNLGITLRNLARLWQATGLTDLPATVAAVLNATSAQVEAAFKQFLAQAESPQPDPPAPPITGGTHP